MPLYEYLCDNCHTKFEIRRPMKESDAPTACPECQSDQVERQISLVATLTRDGAGAAMASGGCGCGSGCGCATRGGQV